jgi:serine/threonine protein kinase
VNWRRRPAVSEPPGLAATTAAPEKHADEKQPEPASWNLDVGAEIASARSVLKRIGGGSRYEVYLVWDGRLHSLTVAKILRPDKAEDEHALRELRREAELLERLAHPVLVRGFDTVLDRPYPHVLLEHLEGPTLRRLIRRHHALPLEQLLPLALHIAAALHYLSVERVVHLDVKPGNIVMGVPPRLIDLSIARSFEQAVRLREPIGTDAYMAPEQCEPSSVPGRIGAAADIWGLGATLHHAMTAELPFPRAPGSGVSPDPTVRFPQLVTEPKRLPKWVPQPLEDLVSRTLAKDPAERPAGGEVAEALEPLVADLSHRIRGRRARVTPPERAV